jgi:hypothetical protein
MCRNHFFLFRDQIPRLTYNWQRENGPTVKQDDMGCPLSLSVLFHGGTDALCTVRDVAVGVEQLAK